MGLVWLVCRGQSSFCAMMTGTSSRNISAGRKAHGQGTRMMRRRMHEGKRLHDAVVKCVDQREKVCDQGSWDTSAGQHIAKHPLLSKHGSSLAWRLT
jgi:hypothetical protein